MTKAPRTGAVGTNATQSHPVYRNDDAFETCGVTFRYGSTTDASGNTATVKPVLSAWEPPRF